MDFFNRLGLGRNRHKTRAQKEASAQETQSLDDVRDRGATSGDELCNALEICKASLGNIESLSPKDIEKATSLLDECAHLIKGRDVKVDVSELDRLLLAVINDSLIKIFMYGQFDLDLQDTRPAWERALGNVRENILARAGDADEVYDAIIRLNILSLRAMNCSLNDMIAAQLQYIADVKKQYRAFCSENGITNIEDVMDPYQTQHLQILLEAIRQAEADIKNNRSIITPNMHDISSMESLLKQRKVSKSSLSPEEFERIRKIIESGNDKLLEIHNTAIKRQEEMQERIKKQDALRNAMERDHLEIAPVISQVESHLSQDILAEPEQTETATIHAEQSHVVDVTLNE